MSLLLKSASGFFLIVLIFIYPAKVYTEEKVDGNADDYFEGDIILDMTRNGARDESLRWPNKTVYYKISEKFNLIQRLEILVAMRNIKIVSCIRFEEAASDRKAYVNIVVDETGHCSSYVGFKNSVQKLNLGDRCFSIGTIMHELLHALGFYHMHETHNRDEYVTIIKDNVQPYTFKNNFEKQDNKIINDFGVEYDYDSIMHYSSDAFTVNGSETIVPHDPGANIGQRDSLSEKDIKKLNLMYKC